MGSPYLAVSLRKVRNEIYDIQAEGIDYVASLEWISRVVGRFQRLGIVNRPCVAPNSKKTIVFVIEWKQDEEKSVVSRSRSILCLFNTKSGLSSLDGSSWTA